MFDKRALNEAFFCNEDVEHADFDDFTVTVESNSFVYLVMKQTNRRLAYFMEVNKNEILILATPSNKLEMSITSYLVERAWFYGIDVAYLKPDDKEDVYVH